MSAAKTMTEKMGATTHDALPSSAGHSRAVCRAVFRLKQSDDTSLCPQSFHPFH